MRKFEVEVKNGNRGYEIQLGKFPRYRAVYGDNTFSFNMITDEERIAAIAACEYIAGALRKGK